MTITREENFGEWYSELVIKSQLIDYTDISGCYVLRPSSFFMWEQVRSYMDPRFAALGVQNSYFPLFVSKDALCKEEDHIDGFAPEVAWVTKSGQTDLAVHIAVRPTSETIIYPLFKKWIRSHNDLPLKVNQWCNVVRWEFKNPTPFLRTREFLWQEGHTAFETKKEAMTEVYQILDIYANTYSEVLAVPTIKGTKTDGEKFPGGETTTTVEGFIPHTGRAIQGATSHCLGKNFGKMFDITIEKSNCEKKKDYVWQNSWGFTTRSLGVSIMNHSDDRGLVVPPRIAIIQVIIIPITFKNEEENKLCYEMCNSMKDRLIKCGIRAQVDDSNKKPGWKYNHYELKGVPLRLECGPRDVKQQKTIGLRRDHDKKQKVTIELKNLETDVKQILKQMHDDLLANATKNLYDGIVVVDSWDEFLKALEKGKLAICPSANTSEVEESIKKRTKEYFDRPDHDVKALSGKAKSLCIPFDQKRWGDISGKKCIDSGAPAQCWILYGRSY